MRSSVDKTYLQEQLGEPDLSNLERLAMEEFAIKRGCRCATIFVEPEQKEVLRVCHVRSREGIRPFFERLRRHGRRRLEAVAMDMNAVY